MDKLDKNPNEYNELDDGSVRVHRMQTTFLYWEKPQIDEVHVILSIIKISTWADTPFPNSQTANTGL